MSAHRQRDGRNRVLVVEDNPGDVRLLQEALGEIDASCEVWVASTLAQAVELLAARPIDATLLDLSLPDSHGADTVARLRKASHHTAIVVMTGNVDERVSAQAADSGADGYLIKGETDPAQLLRTLRIAVQRRAELLELESARADTERRAVHDPLTRLPNRVLFMDRLGQALLTSARTGRALAVLFIDLDHFKTINDTLGHAAGDRLLCESARRMQDGLRASDTVARLGGDEFAVLLTNLAQGSDAERLAAQLHQRLREPIAVQQSAVEPALSIGIAMACGRGVAPEDLLAAADAAMYRAKREGRNRIERAEHLLGAGSRGGESSPADGGPELELGYSPRVCARSGALLGWDAEPLDPAALGAGAPAGEPPAAAAERCARWICERLMCDLPGLPGCSPGAALGLLWRGALPPAEPLLPLVAALRERGLRLELCLADLRLLRWEGGGPLAQLRCEGIGLAYECCEAPEQLWRALRESALDGVRLRAGCVGEPARSALDAALLWGLAHALERLGTPWSVGDVESAAQAEQLASLGCRVLQGPHFGARLPFARLAELAMRCASAAARAPENA